MKDLKIELPFAGFYESWHDEEIDRTIESHFQDDEGETVEGFWDAVMDADINWRDIRQEYCKDYVDWFGQEFGLELEYDGLQSPREYNFSTDRVFAVVNKEEFDTKIRKVVEAYPEWPEVIRERFTSYDGFWSFYSNDYKDEVWTRDVLDECQYGVMLETYIEHLHNEDPNNNREWGEREYECIEDIELYGFSSISDAVEKIEAKLEERKKNEI